MQALAYGQDAETPLLFLDFLSFLAVSLSFSGPPCEIHRNNILIESDRCQVPRPRISKLRSKLSLNVGVSN